MFALDSYEVQGHCSSEVVGFNNGQIRLGDQVADLDGDGRLNRRELKDSGFLKVEQPNKVPEVLNARHISSAIFRRGYGDDLANSSFVGVWHSPSLSIVAVYSLVNGVAQKPRVLLQSSIKVLSVSYFPSIDTPSGVVSIVQRGPLTTRLIRLRLDHGS